ncbi:hypothetical protein ATK17_3506 [Branchiibius hedensis]|uniref:Tat (Twin-arginine translocation) pathway signal sequence n=1 Tax=Branchiibius hedensis TaxID=672460 RepID=A0A2Y8ZX66_9MICO|nr:hypothetical protein [Branchiibius hedensis]PWJ27315.1 hypothetical protein ATK17_3506 [Branchiibius hedensis]SSA36126.1 hypothetical protein SAMN04489750_3506 [Branchiibius hedensis]
MTQQRPPDTADRRVSRRTLAKGAAWTTPVLLVGVVAPPASASPQPGLQGWVDVGKSCNASFAMTLTIDGTGSYPDRGLWVYNAQPAQISNAYITFYYPSGLGTIAWTAASGNSNWSVPAVDATAPVIAGYTAYTTRYSGTWTYHATGTDGPYSTADGDPKFTATVAGAGTYCRNGVSVYARRTVTVNGTVYTFLRGPVSL